MMETITETSALNAPSKVMKKNRRVFHWGNKLSATHSVSSCSSLEGCPEDDTSFYHRSSSLTISEADADDDLLVDKFGFTIEAGETENESLVGDEDKAPSVKDFTSLFRFRRPASIKNKSLRSSQGSDAKDRGWPGMLGLDAIMSKQEGVYNALVAMSQCGPDQGPHGTPLREEYKAVWDGIERDLKRTFPKHILFRESQKDEVNREEGGTTDESSQVGEEIYGKQALRRVLRAYSVYDREIGYCQGMNFIAGMLLMLLTEEEAFWLLVVVMNDELFKLREIFSRDLAEAHEILYIADKLVHCFLPELHDHFEEEQVHTSMFTSQWLMTIFTSTFPFELVSAVWDSFLLDGWKIVYKTLIALLQHAQQDGDLLDRNTEQTLTYLRSFQSKVDAKQILSAAEKIPLKQSHIQRFAFEFRKLVESDEISVHEVVNHEVVHRSDSITTSGSMHLPNIGKVHRFIMKLKHHKRDITVQDLSPKLVPVVGSAKFAVLLNDALSPEECAGLLKRSKGESYQDVLMRHQSGPDSSITARLKRSIVKDMDLSHVLYDRVVHALEGIPELWERFSEASWAKQTNNVPLKVVRLDHKLQFLKFKHGDFEVPLRDDSFSTGDRKSYVTMQVFLDDGFKGGVTTFKGTKRSFEVKAKPGSILLFDQDLLHEECEVVKGRKHMLRAEVVYAPHYSACEYECAM